MFQLFAKIASTVKKMESDDSDVPIQWRTDDEDNDSDSQNTRSNTNRSSRRSNRSNKSSQSKQRHQPETDDDSFRQDPRFMSREKWVNECFIAIRRGDLERVMQIFSQDGGHPNTINFHMFNMGFPVGAGGTMKLPSSSTALHVAAWCGQSDIVRWLLNNGARAEERDGLHQLPVEVASTLDVRRVLGAAKGIVSLSDKVERVTEDMNDGITLVGDQFAIRLARMQAELGDMDYKIETAVREAAREEVLELRSALARKLARELKRFSRSHQEVKTDPLVWEKMNKLERYQVEIDNLHKTVDEIKEDMDRRPLQFGVSEMGEVEAVSGNMGGGGGDAREMKKLKRQVEKNENKFPNEVYDMILARLSSQTFRNFFESHDYFKRWVENNKDIVRYCIFLEDWKPGHYFEMDEKSIVGWSAGDITVLRPGIYHRSSNSGTQFKYTAQITGLLN